MRALLIGVLLVAILALWRDEHAKSLEIAKLEADVHTAARATAESSLEMQGKCSRQAATAFSDAGWKRTAFVDYTNHYNASLNRCFLEITETKIDHGHPSNSIMLVDAFEEKVYGKYFWVNLQDKKFWEVAPLECSVTVPSGEEKTCTSSAEFDELAETYMK
jgi:hypothetical protein